MSDKLFTVQLRRASFKFSGATHCELHKYVTWNQFGIFLTTLTILRANEDGGRRLYEYQVKLMKEGKSFNNKFIRST